MYTWCVRYQFIGFGSKGESFFYVDAATEEAARAFAERWLKLAISAKTQIVRIRKVGG